MFTAPAMCPPLKSCSVLRTSNTTKSSLPLFNAFANSACSTYTAPVKEEGGRQTDADWQIGFFDDFDTFNPDNWQDQILWVNNEDQCYVRDNLYDTREVSNGTLKLRVVDLGKNSPATISTSSAKNIRIPNMSLAVSPRKTARSLLRENGPRG